MGNAEIAGSMFNPQDRDVTFMQETVLKFNCSGNRFKSRLGKILHCSGRFLHWLCSMWSSIQVSIKPHQFDLVFASVYSGLTWLAYAA